MEVMVRLYKTGFAVLLALFAVAANGQVVDKVVSGTSITRVLTDDNNYGGCMAGITADLAALDLVGCKAGYVSFNCAGEAGANTKSEGSNKFQIATLAGLTNNPVTMVVTNGVKFNTDNAGNGYCLAKRIDNIF